MTNSVLWRLALAQACAVPWWSRSAPKHAFEVVRDLPLPELELYDGVLAVRPRRNPFHLLACIMLPSRRGFVHYQ